MRRWLFARETRELPPQEAYALWASGYPPHPHNALMAAEQAVLLSLLPDLAGRTALDAGCGSGRYLRELKSRGAVATGVDLSVEMLREARQLHCPLTRADLQALPFATAALDVVVCGLALGDVGALDRAIAELGRVLQPGGQLLYSVVHPSGEQLGWQRTFDAEGRRWAVSGHWHSAADHRRACAAAGLEIEEWRDAMVASTPAALVIRARRH